MINVKKIIILGVFLSNFTLFNVFSNSDELNISPIVQIISYTDIYGKYPQMMGWGSASIINKNGIIISNDHVVDDGKGALASAFSICITKEINKKPVCDYTASLIARNDKLDLSILKIDNEDIHGNKVDYTKFKTIDIDYNYVPKNQDETIAIGYPWIGADTISETKGIISGISEYNGFKYIKTDTLIAGGNSGGAFIYNGKLIGIPTFGIGGWGENTMGYALSISEAKNFIDENINKDGIKSSITELIDFNLYRKTIENINNNLIIQDDVFNVLIPPDYQVTNYVKNIHFTIELKKQKDTGINNLYIYLEKTPKISNDKEKLYYFETKGLYSKDLQKLIKKTINGIEYFYPVDKSDLSDGNSSWGNSYFAIENGYLITIYVEAPFYDEKRNKEIKIEVEKLLNSIHLNKNNFFKIVTSFSTNIPKINIKSFKNAIVDTGKYKLYLGNLYEYFEIYINELTEYSGKGKTAEEIYNVQLKDVDDSLKTMIKFKGLDGFINCGADYHEGYNYSNYNNYRYGVIDTDEKGNQIILETCKINIYFPLDKNLNRHNYLSLKLISLKNNKQKNLSIAIEFLKRYLKINGVSDETNIPNILKNEIKLKFKDISNQTKDYKNFLKLLVRYNMIENTHYFNGDKLITWGEFLDMYITYVYNFNLNTSKCDKNNYKCKFMNYNVGKKSLDTIFNEIGIIDYDEYIDSGKIYNFDKILNYKLALDDIGNGNLDSFLTLDHMINEEQNILLKQKINDFNNSIYGTKKILLNDFFSNYSTTYFTTKSPRFYINSKKLIIIDNNFKINFSYKNNPDLEKLVGLDKEHYLIFLTKARAIEQIFTQVDFGLFDKKLALKKDTTIDLDISN